MHLTMSIAHPYSWAVQNTDTLNLINPFEKILISGGLGAVWQLCWVVPPDLPQTPTAHGQGGILLQVAIFPFFKLWFCDLLRLHSICILFPYFTFFAIFCSFEIIFYFPFIKIILLLKLQLQNPSLTFCTGTAAGSHQYQDKNNQADILHWICSFFVTILASTKYIV